MKLELKGIASGVNSYNVNERCYIEFILTTESGQTYKTFVRYQDAEWDIEDGGHYYVYGMEVSDGVLLAVTVDRWGRICDACGEWHTEGFWICEENYACSEECAIKLYGGNEMYFRYDTVKKETSWVQWD